jgi:hypothetical protein
MNLLTQLWQQQPDTRLCQLISNVAAKRAQRLGEPIRDDLFYLEDDGFLAQLQIELGKTLEPVDPYHL